MARTITVKGIGHLAAKVDYVILKMMIETVCKDYEQAMREAAERIEAAAKRAFRREAHIGTRRA